MVIIYGTGTVPSEDETCSFWQIGDYMALMANQFGIPTGLCSFTGSIKTGFGAA